MTMETVKQGQHERVKQVAARHGVSVSTIWRWAAAGLITPKKLSHRITVFDSSEVDAAVEKMAGGEA